MTALRCTAKLLKAMKASPVAALAVPRNRLGEWTANLVRVGRIQLVLAVSEPTRFGVVIDAAPYAGVPERFCHALFEALQGIGISADAAVHEVEAMLPLQAAASNSRSVLATLNQYAVHVEADLHYGVAHSAEDLTRRLAETVVCRPVNIGFPADRVREAFGLAPIDPRTRPDALVRQGGEAGHR